MFTLDKPQTDARQHAEALRVGQAVIVDNQILECVPKAKDQLGFGLENGYRLQQIDPAFSLTVETIPTDYPVIILNPAGVEEYASAIKAIDSAELLCVDTETFGKKANKGLHPWLSKIRLVQVFDGKTVYVIDLGGHAINDLPLFSNFSDPNDEGKEKHKVFLDCLRRVCLRVPVIAHNAHYDVLRLRIHLDIEIKKPVCTFIGARVYFGDYGKADEFQKDYSPVLKGGYSLKNLCKRFFNLNIDKSLQMSDWGLPHLSPQQITYASLDTIYCWHLFFYLQKLYADKTKPLYCPQIKKIWTVENRMIPVVVQMEINGIPFDAQLCAQQIDQLTETKAQLLKEWSRLLCPYSHNQSTALLAFINNKYKLRLNDLDKSSLAEHGDLPEIKLRLQIKAIESLLNNLLAFKRSAVRDGRVHTCFRTLTGFGRLSSGDSKNGDDLPNMQAIVNKSNPRIKQFNPPNPREVIRCGVNTRYLIIDLAGAHGRIAADQAEDENAIAGLNDDTVDNHSKVAVYVAKALGKDVTWQEIKLGAKDKKNLLHILAKLARDTAKNTFYGWLNCAGPFRIQSQIASNAGLLVPLEACSGAIEGCKALYPNVLAHRERLHARLKLCRIQIDNDWYVVNHTTDGRRLILRMEPGKYSGELEAPYSQSPASVWSAIEATAIKEAAIIIHNEADPKWNLKMTAIVHDEIDFEVDDQWATEAAAFVNDVIGDCFGCYLKFVNDGREKDVSKLICKSWAEK